MKATAARQAPARDTDAALWQSIPLEVAASAFFVIVAAGLKLAGVFP